MSLLASVAAGEVDLDRVLAGVERRYNAAKTLEVQFSQEYAAQGRSRRPEHGTLYLRKPGRMRWAYSNPQGKLFITDGKLAWFYSPDANRVERTRMKETDDVRAPFAFLLGRLDFRKEFGKFYTRQEGPDAWISAIPKSDRLPFTRVEFLVSPEHVIRRLKILGQDQSEMGFSFTGEKRNVTMAESLFRFQPPQGVEIVDTEQ